MTIDPLHEAILLLRQFAEEAANAATVHGDHPCTVGMSLEKCLARDDCACRLLAIEILALATRKETPVYYNEIPSPDLGDPLVASWPQPSDIRHAIMSDEHVILTLAQFDALESYDDEGGPMTQRSGRCWKSPIPGTKWWRLRWYEVGDVLDPETVRVRERAIFIDRSPTP